MSLPPAQDIRPVLQRMIPYNPLAPRPLPGVAPLPLAEWLAEDEAYAAQMAARAQLLQSQRDRVLQCDDCARPAVQELLQTVLVRRFALSAAAACDRTRVERPDGVEVLVDHDDPLATLGRLVQQDLCVMQKPEGQDEHILTAAVLCFPASWTLAEKFMKPLIGIHRPVDEYDADLARRVQRLFDGVQVDRPLWRFNALWYADPTLHQPRRENDPRQDKASENQRFMRSELQSLFRLPQSRAVVFSIHTYVLTEQAVLAQWGADSTK